MLLLSHLLQGISAGAVCYPRGKALAYPTGKALVYPRGNALAYPKELFCF